MNSAHEKDTEERDVRDFIVIVDCEGLDLGIVTHPPSKFIIIFHNRKLLHTLKSTTPHFLSIIAGIAFAIKLGQAYRDIIEKALSSVILLNGTCFTLLAFSYI